MKTWAQLRVLFVDGQSTEEDRLMHNPHLSALEARHEALERKIDAESHRPLPDSRALADLKKQKLRVKEELSAI
jgi:hypothetical protein